MTPLIVADSINRGVGAQADTGALEGPLAEGSLAEVLQLVEIGLKTGCLTVSSGGVNGLVYFRQGMIVHAAMGERSGRDAVFAMLDISDGTFRFVNQTESTQTDCELPVLMVLMEWAKKRDEAGMVEKVGYN